MEFNVQSSTSLKPPAHVGPHSPLSVLFIYSLNKNTAMDSFFYS